MTEVPPQAFERHGRSPITNVGFVALIRVVPRVTGPLLTVAAARILQPTVYGGYVAAAAFAAIVTQFLENGVNLLIIRDVAKGAWSSANLVVGALLLKAALLMPVLAVAVLGARGLGFDKDVRFLLYLIVLAIVIGTIGNIFDSILQGHQRMDLQAIAVAALSFATLAVSLLGLAKGLGAVSLGLGLIAGNTAYTAVAVVAALKMDKTLTKLRLTGPFARYFLRQSLGFTAGFAASPLYSRGDTVIIARLRGLTAAGLYGVAYSGMLFVSLPAEIVRTAFYPHIGKLSGREAARARSALSQLLRYLTLLGLPAGTVLVVAGPELVRFFFGTRFNDAGGAVQLLGVAIPFIYANKALEAALLIEARMRAFSVIAIGSLATNIAANLLLVPPWGFDLGIRGAAISMLISEVVYLVMAGASLGSGIWLPHLSTFIRGMAAAALVLATLLLSLSRLGLVPTLALGGLTYALAAKLFVLFPEAERMLQTRLRRGLT